MSALQRTLCWRKKEIKKETKEIKKETKEIKKETKEIKKETKEIKKETKEIKEEKIKFTLLLVHMLFYIFNVCLNLNIFFLLYL